MIPYPYDPEEAERLLNEIGWRDEDGDGVLEARDIAGLDDGAPFHVELVTIANPALYALATQVIQQKPRRIGIDMTINAVNLSVLSRITSPLAATASLC